MTKIQYWKDFGWGGGNYFDVRASLGVYKVIFLPRYNSVPRLISNTDEGECFMNFGMEKVRLTKKVRRTINDVQRPPQQLDNLTAEMFADLSGPATRSYRGEWI